MRLENELMVTVLQVSTVLMVEVLLVLMVLTVTVLVALQQPSPVLPYLQFKRYNPRWRFILMKCLCRWQEETLMFMPPTYSALKYFRGHKAPCLVLAHKQVQYV